jgi:hypothetical protein
MYRQKHPGRAGSAEFNRRQALLYKLRTKCSQARAWEQTGKSVANADRVTAQERLQRDEPVDFRIFKDAGTKTGATGTGKPISESP